MNGPIVLHITRLIALFEPHCDDRSTLRDMERTLVLGRSRWRAARGIFQRVRAKRGAAHRAGDDVRVTQYEFEEVCAKTIANLCDVSAAFDADSPYWIVPRALVLARTLGIPDAQVVELVAPSTTD
jgi:hypothetical protein